MKPLTFQIRKGLDLPITGAPKQEIDQGSSVSKVALLGADYVGMKPTMMVKEGDRVTLGQPLFEDKKNPGVLYTAPASGEVVKVQRGAKRVFEALVIRVDGDQTATFDRPTATIGEMTADQVRELLVKSGLWTALRTRPYSKVPALDARCSAIFVSAMDTNPLAADPEVVLTEKAAPFRHGLEALTKLTSGKVFLSSAPNANIPGTDQPGVSWATFDGPHPAGLVGTHIHHLDPVGPTRSVWHVGYQDVCAIGTLLTEGRLDVERIVAIGGPAATKPRLVRSRLGASLQELVASEHSTGERGTRVISGSILNGHAMDGDDATGFLGRYDLQVSLLAEGGERKFLGWHSPGAGMYSVKNVFVSALMRASKRFAFDTSANGSPRAMVPIGSYEKVMPLDILPTFLLRALLSGDTDQAQKLGALELDEEDLGLCTFVDPGKTDYGPILRETLNTIEREG